MIGHALLDHHAVREVGLDKGNDGRGDIGYIDATDPRVLL
jgi:hypothetical protein